MASSLDIAKSKKGAAVDIVDKQLPTKDQETCVKFSNLVRSESASNQCKQKDEDHSIRPSDLIEYEEDYISLWHKANHGSIDLDEKLTSMTGSYSEILDENYQTEPESDNTLVLDDAYMNTMQELCTNLEDRRGINNSKESAQGATPKILNSNDTTSRGQWIETTPEDNICNLIRDFSEKNIISRRSDGCERGVSSTPYMMRNSLYTTLPPIDPTVIGDLEEKARDIATSMDTLIENLTGTLHSISALSVECVETYRDAVCKTCDAVDSNIKSMYQLMAKCEELSKSMKPIYKLHDQIREIRRLLDLFEGIVFSSSAVGAGGGT